MPKHATRVRIDPDEFAGAQAVAERQRVSVAEVVRRGLRRELAAAKEAPMPTPSLADTLRAAGLDEARVAEIVAIIARDRAARGLEVPA